MTEKELEILLIVTHTHIPYQIERIVNLPSD